MTTLSGGSVLRPAREMARDGAEWLAASDPGLNRLRQAGRAVLAMGSTLAVEWVLAGWVGAGSRGALIAMLLGAVVAMLGSMGLSAGPTSQRAATAAILPISMGVGVAAGIAVAGHTDLLLGVFVVVQFVAVYIRRFGHRFFFAGFLVWIGYFFGSFLSAPFSEMPRIMLYVVVAAAWVLLLSLTVLKENPTRTLRHMVQAFTTRAESVADSAARVLEGASDRSWSRLHRRQRLLDEAALMIEGQLGEDDAVPADWSAVTLRRELVDAQLAIDEIVAATFSLVCAGTTQGLRDAARDMLACLAAGRHEVAEEAAAALYRAIDDADRDQDDGEQGRYAARRLAGSVEGYCRRIDRWRSRGVGAPSHPDPRDGQPDFTSSVTLMMGQLPGSASVAGEVSARSASWNPLARLPLTTRQAIQVALAGGLAILAGRELSQQRYYWAVIAAFIAFTGTSTAADTFLKSINRVVGTAAGLGVAIVLANLTAGHSSTVLAVILASIFCGFYLRQISYAYMIFFITIMVAQLYSVLHEFTDQLLVLRLEETAIGAGIGIGVALLVMPVGAHATSRAAATIFFTGLHQLLAAAADHLDLPDPADDATDRDDDEAQDLDGLARILDGHLNQLRQTLHPLTVSLTLRPDTHQIRHRLSLYALAATTSRALVSDVRQTPLPSPALASACRSLAQAAQALADRQGPDASLRAANDDLQQAQESLDHLKGTGSRDHRHEVERSYRVLATLLYALDRLADNSFTTRPLPAAQRPIDIS